MKVEKYQIGDWVDLVIVIIFTTICFYAMVVA